MGTCCPLLGEFILILCDFVVVTAGGGGGAVPWAAAVIVLDTMASLHIAKTRIIPKAIAGICI